MPTRKALEIAYSMGLDLVEVAPNANPPVAKIMDYGKFLYEERKKKRDAKRADPKKRVAGEVKEMELRPTIGIHDLAVKTRKIREFLEDGYKVKIRVFYKGREIVHKEQGYDVLNAVLAQISDLAVIEFEPKLEGHNLICIVRPISRKQEVGGKKNAQNENKA